MNSTQLKKFCKALSIRNVPTKDKGWVEIPCPFAPWKHDNGRDGNPSFGILVSPYKPSKCHCFSCGFSGGMIELVQGIRFYAGKDPMYDYKTAMASALLDEDEGGMETGYADDEDEEHVRATHYYSEKWLSTFVSATKSEDAMLYLQSRGTPKSIIKELDLRYDSDLCRVCFPVRDFDGRLVGFHGRAVKKAIRPPYRMYPLYKDNGKVVRTSDDKFITNPQYWFGEHLVDLDKPIVVVESVFDFTRVYEVYKNVICPLSANMTLDKIKRLSEATFLIRMFDGDTPGRRASYTLKRELSHIPSVNIALEEGTDPGVLSAGKIAKLIGPYIENVLTA